VLFKPPLRQVAKTLPREIANSHYENTPLKDWVEQPSLIIADEIAQLSPAQLETMKAFLGSLKSEPQE